MLVFLQMMVNVDDKGYGVYSCPGVHEAGLYRACSDALFGRWWRHGADRWTWDERRGVWPLQPKLPLEAHL